MVGSGQLKRRNSKRLNYSQQYCILKWTGHLRGDNRTYDVGDAMTSLSPLSPLFCAERQNVNKEDRRDDNSEQRRICRICGDSHLRRYSDVRFVFDAS